MRRLITGLQTQAQPLPCSFAHSVVLTTPEMNKKVISMCVVEVMRDERLVAYPATNLVVRETKAAWQRVYHFMVRGW